MKTKNIVLISLCCILGLSLSGCVNTEKTIATPNTDQMIKGTLICNGVPDQNFKVIVTGTAGQSSSTMTDQEGHYSIKINFDPQTINVYYGDTLVSTFSSPFDYSRNYSVQYETLGAGK